MPCLGEDGARGVPLPGQAVAPLKQVEHRRDSGKACAGTVSSPIGAQTLAHIAPPAALLLGVRPPPPRDPVHGAQGLPAQLLLAMLGDALRDPDLSWGLHLSLLYGACLRGSLRRGPRPFSGGSMTQLFGKPPVSKYVVPQSDSDQVTRPEIRERYIHLCFLNYVRYCDIISCEKTPVKIFTF